MAHIEETSIEILNKENLNPEYPELKICLKVQKEPKENSKKLLFFEKFNFKKSLESKVDIFSIHRKPKKKEIFARYSRKEKSLGQLSKKFLKIFGKMKNQEVSLDSVTTILGVERRRIYDIINILESLGVVFRRGKNHYYWIGLVAISKKISNLMLKISNDGLDMSKIKQPQAKQKSLGFLAIGFIKLFIGWRSLITLEQAAQKLTLPEENHKLKTKIRRLYDIANVFLALGIITKSYLPNRKPAFKWLGLVGLDKLLRNVTTEKMLGPIDIDCQEYTLNTLRKTVSLQERPDGMKDIAYGKLWKCHELKLKKVLSEDQEVMELLNGVELPNLKALSACDDSDLRHEFSPMRLPMTGRSAFMQCGYQKVDGQKFDKILSEIFNSNLTPKQKRIDLEMNSTACKSSEVTGPLNLKTINERSLTTFIKAEKVSNVLFDRTISSSNLTKRGKSSFKKISDFNSGVFSASKKLKMKASEAENILENLFIKMQ